jgi:hypothetical protein
MPSTPLLSGRPLPGIFPGLMYELYADREVFRDDDQGLLVEWNPTGVPVLASDGLELLPHCGRVISHRTEPRQFEGPDPWVLIERRFMPLATLKTLKLRVPTNETQDRTKSSHTTGGERRYYSSVSALLAREMASAPALDALVRWSTDQTNRPLSHQPWDFKCDAASCKLLSGWGWDASSPPPPDGTGWGGWDPAHLETAPMYGLGLQGDSLGAVMVLMLMRWVQKALPIDKTHWRNQPRTIAWRLKSLVHFESMGGSSCDPALLAAWGIKKPKADLRSAVDYLIANWPRLGAGNLDKRVLPIIKDPDAAALGLPSGVELVGTYLFQEMAFLWCCIYAAETGFLGPTRARTLIELTRAHWEHLRDRAVNTGGMAAAVSRNVDFANAQEIADVCTRLDSAPGENGRTYSPCAVNGIRSHYRPDDCEMALPVAGYFQAATAPVGWLEDGVRKIAKMPGQTKFVDEAARYLLPYLAMEDGTFTPTL